MIKFGPGGNDNVFYSMKYKNTAEFMKYLNQIGLDAYEYECTRGVRISQKQEEQLKNEALKYNITLSLHSPYYISLSTQEPQKKLNTIKYIIDSMTAAKNIGANRVVVHAGSTLNLDRNYALDCACKLLKQALYEADNLNLSDVILCPETMGKINQLGNSQEIIAMCLIDDRLIPTIDFGHLYCRYLGKLKTEQDFETELKLYIDKLGYEKMKHFHCHFSKIEYSNGGEKKHLTFKDQNFGSDFVEVAKTLKKLKLEPIIICESAGTQTEDAVCMKKIYQSL